VLLSSTTGGCLTATGLKEAIDLDDSKQQRVRLSTGSLSSEVRLPARGESFFVGGYLSPRKPIPTGSRGHVAQSVYATWPVDGDRGGGVVQGQLREGGALEPRVSEPCGDRVQMPSESVELALGSAGARTHVSQVVPRPSDWAMEPLSAADRHPAHASRNQDGDFYLNGVQSRRRDHPVTRATLPDPDCVYRGS